MGKVYDGIIGLAIGDALGVPAEFEAREEMAENPVAGMRGGGIHRQPAGTWSDDTGLTLALLDSIAVRRGIDCRDIMDHFVLWMEDGEYTASGKAFDIGHTTAEAVRNYKCGINPPECGGAADDDNGNGSLMRILPVAFYLHLRPELSVDEGMELVHLVSSLTHRHRVSLIGCGIYVSAALKLMAEGMTVKEGVKQGIGEAFRYYERRGWDEELFSYNRLRDLDIFASFSEKDIRSSGYVVDTLEAALWCLLNTDSFHDCVLKAVNLGDDTDTVGAVAGGLAGIYYGACGIPGEWLEVLKRRQYIQKLCTKMEMAFENDERGEGEEPEDAV